MEITDEQKKVIIANILKEVNTKDSARVGYHAEQFLKVAQFSLPPNILSKIEAKIRQDKRYQSRQYIGNSKAIGDYEIIKNENYAFEWMKELKKVSLTVLGSLIAGTLLWWLTVRPANVQLKNRIDKAEKIITDSILNKK